MIKQTRIGTISPNVDGLDLYLLLEDSEDVITMNKVEAFFDDNYRAETTQEAGGYFCRLYKWLPIDSDLSCGVLIVYQQYDV